MTKKFFLAFTFIHLTAHGVFAQTNNQAEKILDNLLNAAKTSAIKTNFKLIVIEKSNTQPNVATGIFTLKGNKFVLDMIQMKVWFNGKTQWSYSESNNEVSITEPTEKEIAETNPMAIISGFKSKCDIRFASKKSSQNHVIDMIPKTKNKDIARLQVEINKTTGNLYSIKVSYTNGTLSTLTLSNFEKAIKVSDNLFVFNQNKHKGVTINDLR